MPIQILDATAWREYRGPVTEGSSLTHIAKIARPDRNGEEPLCFVKLVPDNKFPTLLCEAMGWVLAGHAGLTRPPFVAIVMVDVAILNRSQLLPKDVLNGSQFCAAWCSQALDGKSLRQPNMGSLIVDRKAFLRTVDSRKIAAFDEWTNLRDRNLGNVIKINKGGYGVIDNETLLYDYLWPKTAGLNSNRLIEHAKHALDTKEYKRFKVEMANAAKGHTGALASAENDLESVLKMIVPKDPSAKSVIVALLEARCKNDWLQNQLKVIA